MEKSTRKTVNLMHDTVDEEQAVAEKRTSEKKIELHSYAQEILTDIEYRQQFKVKEEADGEELDLTPNCIEDAPFIERFINYVSHMRHEMTMMPLTHTQFNASRLRTRTSMRGGIGGQKQSIDELIAGIMAETIMFDPVAKDNADQETPEVPYKKSFVKVTLLKSPFFEIHNQLATTEAKGTRLGDLVEADNRLYEYLTVGKGKIRRRADNEAQTNVILTNSRAVNTVTVENATVSSYVSNFEMYDTMEGVLRKTNVPFSPNQPAEVQTDGEDSVAAAFREQEHQREKQKSKDLASELYKTSAFKQAIIFIGRSLSSNSFKSGMQRFRNFQALDRCSPEVQYKYSMHVLFRLSPVPSREERKAVSDMSFCCRNSDILAISYGLFSFSSQHVPNSGDVYVWSIKNPGEPERAYYYDIPVTAVCFSPFLPSLIAIGMYDGSVEVRDVADLKASPISISQRSTSTSVAPIVAIRWLKQTDDDDPNEIDPFLSLSQDGTVTRYRLSKTPYLIGFTQMVLERIEGHPEGIRVPLHPGTSIQSNRHPQGLSITTHPIYNDIYYILTDEGCIHKCSINYQHQYLEVLKCHDGGVNCMQFSPWSCKLFLTCGNDWYVRIWVEGMTRPIIELIDDFQPVHWACWSPINSTIIISLNRKVTNIWDLRRNILKPMGKHEMDNSFNTTAQFSNSGTVLVVGNERGAALFQALDDMPYSPHFQYDELEKAIFKAVGNDQDLLIELKSIGFFGYPNKISVKP